MGAIFVPLRQPTQGYRALPSERVTGRPRGAPERGILPPMRVALMTAGSRGDAAPYTGLGHALGRAGHEVSLVTHGRFASLAADAGLAFQPLATDPRAAMESEKGRALQRCSTGAGQLVRVVAPRSVSRPGPYRCAASPRTP
ncbi:hypothetical protein GCM10020221_09400 [Streptomyces thioluteus]|uniref:Glycosyltransferase family 28 N-terminal domain-containing protein n=1 Tax=Streptomyces thioluteus TaxID=66431 RepID=A0ABN3WIH7_STRTU